MKKTTKTSARKAKKTTQRQLIENLFRAVADFENEAKDRMIRLLNRMSDQEQFARETRQSIEQRIDAMRHEQVALAQEQAAKPTDPPPAEKWVPKVGDWANWRGKTECGPHQVEKVGPGETLEMKDLPFLYNWCEWTPLSEAEIAEHKRSEEARLKSEAEAKELAMPLKMGTPIRMKIPAHVEGLYLKKYLGRHLVYFEDDDAPSTMLRSEFTVIP